MVLYIEEMIDASDRFIEAATLLKTPFRTARPFEQITTEPNSHFRGSIYGYINNKTDNFVPMKNFRAEQLFKYGDLFLNADGKIDRLGNLESWPDKMFLKSNVGTKSICGGLYSFDELKDFDPEEFVLVASPKEIIQEVRLFVSDQIITGSTYLSNDEIVELPLPAENFEEIVQVVLKIWRPAPIFVCDLAKTLEGWKLLELNAWNCSGVYSSDVVAILKELTKFYA